MTSNVFYDFPNMDKAQVPVSDKTINKIWNKGIRIQKTTKPHTGTLVYVKKHNLTPFKSSVTKIKSKMWNFLNFEQISARDAFSGITRKLSQWSKHLIARTTALRPNTIYVYPNMVENIRKIVIFGKYDQKWHQNGAKLVVGGAQNPIKCWKMPKITWKLAAEHKVY